MVRKASIGLAILGVMSWVGCVGKAPIRGPAVTPPSAAQIRKADLASHLQGAWENAGKGGNRQMIFGPGGQLTFQGGLEFFNPAHWELDADNQELKITMPVAAD